MKKYKDDDLDFCGYFNMVDVNAVNASDPGFRKIRSAGLVSVEWKRCEAVVDGDDFA